MPVQDLDFRLGIIGFLCGSEKGAPVTFDLYAGAQKMGQGVYSYQTTIVFPFQKACFFQTVKKYFFLF